MKPYLVLCLLSSVLTGCLSSDVSSRAEFKKHFQSDLTIRRPSTLQSKEYMKNPMSGEMATSYFLEEDGFQNPGVTIVIDPSPSSPPNVRVPIGTSVKIAKIERQNLVDAGIETFATGTLSGTKIGKNINFIFKLSADFGRQIRRSPWEAPDQPVLRPAQGSGWVDTHVVAPTN